MHTVLESDGDVSVVHFSLCIIVSRAQIHSFGSNDEVGKDTRRTMMIAAARITT